MALDHEMVRRLRYIFVEKPIPSEIAESVERLLVLNRKLGHHGIRDETVALLVHLHELREARRELTPAAQEPPILDTPGPTPGVSGEVPPAGDTGNAPSDPVISESAPPPADTGTPGGNPPVKRGPGRPPTKKATAVTADAK